MLIEKIKINNLLSFGPDSNEIELGPLNVLIGPNGSGKSNFIDAISLLNWAPRNTPFTQYINSNFEDWIWKGQPTGESGFSAVIKMASETPETIYQIVLRKNFFNTADIYEKVDKMSLGGNKKETIYSRSLENNTDIQIRRSGSEEDFKLNVGTFDGSHSILSQLKEPTIYPELFFLGMAFLQIWFYRIWSFGRFSVSRMPQKTDLPNNYLFEDASNLGLVLNNLKKNPKVKKDILKSLQILYPSISDFDVSIDTGTAQIYFTENDYILPATRLSDGTLRYLCLLAILLNPAQPFLICIEEPELGLHPDVLPTIADLLKQASEKTQLIVTTHSDILVDALSDTPESVLVCDKVNGSTVMKRLEADKLKVWLEDYSLGNLWTSGQIGGTRW